MPLSGAVQFTKTGVAYRSTQVPSSIQASPQAGLLLVHGAGFNKGSWESVINELGKKLLCDCPGVCLWVIVPDLSGHGESRCYPKQFTAEPGSAFQNIEYEVFAHDALQCLEQERLGSLPIYAVGHSLGASIIALALLLRPGIFKAVVMFEPIIIPEFTEAQVRAGGIDPTQPNPLSTMLLRRRDRFPSRKSAIQYLVNRAPYKHFSPHAAEACLHDGLKEVAFSQSEVALSCKTEFEAALYNSRDGGLFGIFERLGDLDTNVLISSGENSHQMDMNALLLGITGKDDRDNLPVSLTGRYYQKISAKCAKGHYVVLNGAGHFAPMEKPADFASMCASHIEKHLPGNNDNLSCGSISVYERFFAGSSKL